jgi:hypothetical protein
MKGNTRKNARQNHTAFSHQVTYALPAQYHSTCRAVHHILATQSCCYPGIGATQLGGEGYRLERTRLVCDPGRQAKAANERDRDSEKRVGSEWRNWGNKKQKQETKQNEPNQSNNYDEIITQQKLTKKKPN